MVDSITFDTTAGVLVVVLVDGTEQQYRDAAEYLGDFPDRASDVVAMGWSISAPGVGT